MLKNSIVINDLLIFIYNMLITTHQRYWLNNDNSNKLTNLNHFLKCTYLCKYIINVYHIFRLKYRCFAYALSMIDPSLYRSYPITHTLYRIPKTFQKFQKFHKISTFFKNFQNFKNFKFSKNSKFS